MRFLLAFFAWVAGHRSRNLSRRDLLARGSAFVIAWACVLAEGQQSSPQPSDGDLLFEGVLSDLKPMLTGGYRFELVRDRTAPVVPWVVKISPGTGSLALAVPKEGETVKYPIGDSQLEVKYLRYNLTPPWEPYQAEIVVRRRPRLEVALGGPCRILWETRQDTELVYLENSLLRVGFVPLASGQIVELFFKRTGHNYQHAELERFKGTTGVVDRGGFKEMINEFGTLFHRPFKLKTLAETPDEASVELAVDDPDKSVSYRRMLSLYRDEARIRIHTELRPYQKDKVQVRVQYHNEIRPGGDVDTADVFCFMNQAGATVVRPYGDHETLKLGKGWVAAVDQGKREALVGVYDLKQLDFVYVFTCNGLCNLEHFTRPEAVTAESPQTTDVSYLLVHGLDRIDSAGEDCVLAVDTDRTHYGANTVAKILVRAAFVSPTPSASVQVAVSPKDSEKAPPLWTQKKTVEVRNPGLAFPAEFAWGIGDLPDGEYRVKAALIRNEQTVVECSRPVFLVSKAIAETRERINAARTELEGLKTAFKRLDQTRTREVRALIGQAFYLLTEAEEAERTGNRDALEALLTRYEETAAKTRSVANR